MLVIAGLDRQLELSRKSGPSLQLDHVSALGAVQRVLEIAGMVNFPSLTGRRGIGKRSSNVDLRQGRWPVHCRGALLGAEPPRNHGDKERNEEGALDGE